MQLENRLDAHGPLEQTEQVFVFERPTYATPTLEELSATVLYDSQRLFNEGRYEISRVSVPRIGMRLPGGLTIKNVISESVVFQEDLGGVGNIYTAHPNGNGSTRFYGPKKKDGSRNVDKKVW